MKLKLAYVLLVALMAIVAGCGGSEKSAATTTSTTAEATTTEETTTEETTTEETTTTEDSSGNDGNSSSFASSKNCLELLNLSAAFSKAAATGGGDDDLDTTVKFFEQVADKAPDDIKGDFKVIAKAFAAYAKALQDANFKPGQQPTPEQIEKLTKAAESFNQAEVTKASEHISVWAQKNCPS